MASGQILSFGRIAFETRYGFRIEFRRTRKKSYVTVQDRRLTTAQTRHLKLPLNNQDRRIFKKYTGRGIGGGDFVLIEEIANSPRWSNRKWELLHILFEATGRAAERCKPFTRPHVSQGTDERVSPQLSY